MAAASRPLFLFLGRYLVTLSVFLVVPATVVISGSLASFIIQDLRYRMVGGRSLVEAVRWLLEHESPAGLWSDALPRHWELIQLMFILAPFSAIMMTLPNGWRNPYRGMMMTMLPLLSVLCALWILPGAAHVWHSELLFGSIVGPIATMMGVYMVRRLYVWLER